MKKLIVLFFPLLLFIIFYSCNKDNSSVVAPTKKDDNVKLQKKNKWPKKIYDSTYGEIVIDYNVITPSKYPCGIKDTYGWGWDHYQSKVGRYLGIWTGIKTPSQLYQKYGFNQFFIGDRQAALSAGFKEDSLMGGINFAPTSVDQYGRLGYYHLDEPIEKGASPENIRWIAQYIHDYYPSSKLMLSSYKSIPSATSLSYLSVLTNASNTYIMCDQYYDGTIWYGHDQRQFWTDYKNFYTPPRVPAHWISGLTDGAQGDFPMLFGHANNLGVNSLWLFMLTSNDPYVIDQFCFSGWNNGWLRKFEQYYCIEWHCDYGCECDPSNPGDWYVYKVWPLGNTREVFP